MTAGSRVQICGHRDVAFPVIGSLCGGEACLDGKDSGVGFLGLRCKGNPIFRSVLGFHFFLGLEARVGLCSLSRLRSRLGSSSVWSGVVGISPFVLVSRQKRFLQPNSGRNFSVLAVRMCVGSIPLGGVRRKYQCRVKLQGWAQRVETSMLRRH